VQPNQAARLLLLAAGPPGDGHDYRVYYALTHMFVTIAYLLLFYLLATSFRSSLAIIEADSGMPSDKAAAPII